MKVYDMTSVITAGFKKKVARPADVACWGHYEYWFGLSDGGKVHSWNQ